MPNRPLYFDPYVLALAAKRPHGPFRLGSDLGADPVLRDMRKAMVIKYRPPGDTWWLRVMMLIYGDALRSMDDLHEVNEIDSPYLQWAL
jgi:hypothetical protein